MRNEARDPDQSKISIPLKGCKIHSELANQTNQANPTKLIVLIVLIVPIWVLSLKTLLIGREFTIGNILSPFRRRIFHFRSQISVRLSKFWWVFS